MKEKINDWLQVAGFIGVIASLIFVGYEIKQSREIAMAELYQARVASGFQIAHAEATDQSAWKSFEKDMRGEELTSWERVQVDRYNSMYFNHLENNHYLYQMGLLDQEQWDASLRGIENLMKIEALQRWWVEARLGYRASFANVVDEAIDKSKPEE